MKYNELFKRKTIKTRRKALDSSRGQSSPKHFFATVSFPACIKMEAGAPGPQRPPPAR